MSQECCRESDAWCAAMMMLMRRFRLPRGFAEFGIAHRKLDLELRMSLASEQRSA